MATQSDIGFGTTITFSSGVFTGFLRNVDWELGERSAVDSSHMSTTNGWRTFIPGDLKDPGTLTCELLFNIGNLAGYKTMVNSTVETITVTFPTQGSGGTWACSGFCTSASGTIPMDDMMSATVNLKFTGEPTMTNGST